jgi:hypothetical protein
MSVHTSRRLSDYASAAEIENLVTALKTAYREYGHQMAEAKQAAGADLLQQPGETSTLCEVAKVKNWLAAFLIVAFLFGLSGCHCQDIGGTDITIPTSDSTPPTLEVKFQMPDGTIVTRTTSPAAGEDVIVVPDHGHLPFAGTIIITARSIDRQGAKEIKIFAAEMNCIGPTCSSPGLLGGPSASSVNTDPPGGPGCSVIQAIHTVDVHSSPLLTAPDEIGHYNQWEISVEGVNFGGQSTFIGFFYLVHYPGGIVSCCW